MLAMDDRLRCRCDRHSQVCNAAATQEDMRCDTCRDPGCSSGFIAPPGTETPGIDPAAEGWSPLGHFRIDGLVFSVPGTDARGASSRPESFAGLSLPGEPLTLTVPLPARGEPAAWLPGS
jgi:hypothetical protein